MVYQGHGFESRWRCICLSVWSHKHCPVDILWCHRYLSVPFGKIDLGQVFLAFELSECHCHRFRAHFGALVQLLQSTHTLLTCKVTLMVSRLPSPAYCPPYSAALRSWYLRLKSFSIRRWSSVRSSSSGRSSPSCRSSASPCQTLDVSGKIIHPLLRTIQFGSL